MMPREFGLLTYRVPIPRWNTVPSLSSQVLQSLGGGGKHLTFLTCYGLPDASPRDRLWSLLRPTQRRDPYPAPLAEERHQDVPSEDQRRCRHSRPPLVA